MRFWRTSTLTVVLRLAGADGELFDLAALERDLLGRGGLGRLVVLAVRAAQEAEQLHLLGAADHLVRPAEGHAGAGELLEQLLGRHAQHFGQRTYGDFRHVGVIPCVRRQCAPGVTAVFKLRALTRTSAGARP